MVAVALDALERQWRPQWRPLQCSRLQSPRAGGACCAVVHGAAEGGARLSDFTFPFHFHALERQWRPLQCSRLQSPRAGGACCAAVHGAAEGGARLSDAAAAAAMAVHFVLLSNLTVGATRVFM